MAQEGNVYLDLYCNDQGGWRTNNDYLDAITLEAIRPLGWAGRQINWRINGRPVVWFVCGDRLCARIRQDNE